MSKKNIIAAPLVCKGTSFEDLMLSFEKSIKTLPYEITIIQQAIKNKQLSSPDLFDNWSDMIEYIAFLRELLIQDCDHILFLDFFCPGLDIIQYYEELSNSKIKKWALLHWWTFLEHDLYKWKWLSDAETFRFETFDCIYVPSDHLFSKVPDKYKSKTFVFPWWMDHLKTNSNESNTTKEYDVIFPHRLAKDKWVNDFIYIAERLPQINFLVTSYLEYSENEYIEELKSLKNVTFRFGEDKDNHIATIQKAKIILSCAYQENYGYAVMKGVNYGCIPVLPNREVYPEYFPKTVLYDNLDEAIKMIESFLIEPPILNSIKVEHSLIHLVKHFFDEQ